MTSMMQMPIECYATFLRCEFKQTSSCCYLQFCSLFWL